MLLAADSKNFLLAQRCIRHTPEKPLDAILIWTNLVRIPIVMQGTRHFPSFRRLLAPGLTMPSLSRQSVCISVPSNGTSNGRARLPCQVKWQASYHITPSTAHKPTCRGLRQISSLRQSLGVRTLSCWPRIFSFLFAATCKPCWRGHLGPMRSWLHMYTQHDPIFSQITIRFYLFLPQTLSGKGSPVTCR